MIDQLTADRYAESFPTAPPEEQERMRTALTEYRDAEQARDEKMQDEHFDRAYRDDAYFASYSKQPEIAAATGPLDDQATIAADSLNRAFLSQAFGMPVDLVSSNYENLKDTYTQTYFNRTGVGATELRSLIRGQFEQRDVARKQIERLPAQLALAKFEDLESGRSRSGAEILNEIRSKNPQAFRPEWELPMLQMVSSIEQDTDARMRGLTPEAHRVFNILAKQTGVKERPDLQPHPSGTGDSKEIVDLLLKSPDKVDDILEMASLVSSETGDPKKFLHQLGESVGRSLGDIAGSTNLMAQEIYYERLKLMASGPLSPLRVRDTADGKLIPITQVPSQYNPGSLEGRLATEEDRKRLRANADEALAMIAVRRKIDRFAKDFDPIKPNATGFLGMLEQGAYNTASSAPLLAATAIPYVGIPIAASASTALTYDDIRAREKDTSVGLAFARASLTGLLQTSLDKVQLGQLAGRNPVTGGLVRELLQPDSPLIKRIALKAAGNYAEQTGVEITQNSVPLMVDLLAKTLGADMPDFNAEERLAELKAATPQTFVDTLFPWFIGTGVISVKEMKNGERFRKNTAGFEDMGIPKSEARDLATTESAEEFDRKFREAFDKLTPEQRSNYIARKNAQTHGDMPSAERNGNEWIIRSNDGREIYRTTNEEAAQAAFDIEAKRASETAALKMSKSGKATPADIGRHWLKIAEDPETMILGETPTEKDMPTVFRKLAGPVADDVVIESLSAGGSSYIKFTEKTSGGHILLNISNPKAVYLHSVSAGVFGTQIYQSAFAWAFNNGMRMVGDPNGFLRLGPIRYTTHMFNSALRFRSTRHMLPHPKEPLDGWRTDDSQEATEHNIGLLAMREAQLVRENLNWLQDLRYSDGRFYDGNTPIPIDAEGRNRYIRSRVTSADSNFTGGAGPRTVARALVTLAAEEAAKRDGLVGKPPDTASLKELRYSQAPENATFSEVPRSQVETWVATTLHNWRKDIAVHIHDSADVIPDENLRHAVLKEDGSVEGFYNPADRSIHILADRMNSEADVQRVLRHEGMHWAFANALQKEYHELLAGTRIKIPSDKLKELRLKYRDASDATIVEEYLAYEGQNNPKSTVWRSFAYETKRLLQKVFGDRVEFTDKDILAFLSKANRRLTDKKAENQPKNSSAERWKTEGSSFSKAQQGSENDLLKFSGSDTAETNGSGDSASVRMLAGQGTGGRGDSAHRQSVGEEWRNAASGFQRLGVTVVFGQNTTGVVPRPNGGLILNLDQHAIAGREAISTRGGFEPGTSARLVFGEELIHAAHLSALKKDWIAGGKLSTFDDFVANENRAVFDDIRNTINSAPTDQKARLKEAVFSAYHAYFTHFSEGIKDVTNVETALADIEKGGKALRFVSEFVREAVQLKRQGAITEEVTASLLERLGNWVRKALQRVRETLPGVFTGEFGQQAQMLATRIEAELNALSGTPPKRANMAISEGPRGGLEFHAKDIDPMLRRPTDSMFLSRKQGKPNEEESRNARERAENEVSINKSTASIGDGNYSVAKTIRFEDYAEGETPSADERAIEELRRILGRDGSKNLRAVRPSKVLLGDEAIGQSGISEENSIEYSSSPIAAFVAAYEKAFSKRVVFIAADSLLPDGASVSTGRNTVFVDSRAVQGVDFLTGHELIHAIKAQNPALYGRMLNELLPMAQNTKEYKKRVQTLAPGEYRKDELDDELLGDFIGAQFTNAPFWKALHARDKSLFEKIAQAALDIIEKIFTAARSLLRDPSASFTELNKARELLTDILREYAKSGNFPDRDLPESSDADLATAKSRD